MTKRNAREVAKTIVDKRQTLARTSHRPVRYTDASASFGTLTVKETDKEKMTSSRFAGFHHSILHKSEKYVDYTFDYIF